MERALIQSPFCVWGLFKRVWKTLLDSFVNNVLIYKQF